MPTVQQLWPPIVSSTNLPRRKPAAGRRVYEALQRPGSLTLDELRKVAYSTDMHKRNPASILVLLKRLDMRLSRFGLAIARVGIGQADHVYLLVGM